MERTVSRSRTKQTRERHRKASKSAERPMPWWQSPAVGLLIGITLWLSVVFLTWFKSSLARGGVSCFCLPVLGDAAFLLISLFGAAVFLEITDPALIRRNSRILLLAIIALLALVIAKAVMIAAASSGLVDPDISLFLLPLVIAPLLATILMTRTVGIASGVWTSIAMATMVGRSFPMLITGLTVTVVASSMSARLRTRTKVIRTGLVVGLTEIACVFGVTALNGQASDIKIVLYQAAACLVSGVASAIVVLLILPFFETAFRITTDITLLELSALEHPLLQRLAIEAPGTYHHSMLVAQLARAAADEIGANSLMARVCAYYHDIGKLTKPEFFSENIRMQSNPHDDLPPSMSTLVITAHVKEGLSLALLHKLPIPIQRVITEHHGTSLISCFHHKASQIEQDGGSTRKPPGTGQQKVDESDFRYGGPRPASRESAIICLADAVEAASRSIEKTTPAHIEGLVGDIVKGKMDDGQLDDSGLTLNEIARIKRSFAFTLTNMMHGRVPYPKDENRNKQPSEPVPGGQTEDS